MKMKIIILLTIMINVSSYAAPPENSDDVMKHLEFVGYDVTMDTKAIIAKHPKRSNLRIAKLSGGMVILSYYGLTQYGLNNMGSLLPIMNDLNKKSTAIKFVTTGKEIRLEAWYPGGYNKKSFSHLLDALEQDRKLLFGVSDKLKKYLK